MAETEIDFARSVLNRQSGFEATPGNASRPPGGGAASFTRYLRDNSDFENGVNSLPDQREARFFRVDESSGDRPSEPEFLSDWSARDKPWDRHRADADRVAEIYQSHPKFQKWGGRMEVCALKLGFAWAPDVLDRNALTLKLRESRFCRVRHCPICQWRRCLMWQARFLAAVPKLLARFPKARFIFLTLTVKNVAVATLRSVLRDMNVAWGRLSQCEPFNVVLGWIRTTEVTRQPDLIAHPHFHVLLMVRPSYFTSGYITQPRWVQMWRAALRADYDPVVDIRPAKAFGPKRTDFMQAARETLKYAVKPSDMIDDVPWFLELSEQVKKLRFISAGGELKEVMRPDEESEAELLLLRESESNDDGALVYFGWYRVKTRYRKAGQAVRAKA